MAHRTRPAPVASRIAAVAALCCAVAVAVPGAAAAGGPTSVLLASPYTDSAAAFYYSDEDYATLTTLLGGADAPTGSVDPPGASAAGAPFVTATWLIHDVQIWRIDRIFVVAPDDIWIVTRTSSGGTLTGEGMFPGETGATGAVWHRPAAEDQLLALLDRHGLTVDAQRLDGGRPIVAATADRAAAAGGDVPAGTTTAAAVGPATGTPPGWVWGLGGLAAGVAAGAAALALIHRLRSRSAADEAPVPMIPVG